MFEWGRKAPGRGCGCVTERRSLGRLHRFREGESAGGSLPFFFIFPSLFLLWNSPSFPLPSLMIQKL